MRKQEFLDTLRRNLKVLRQDEIDDILEEYSGYIESMMEEGRTEEEAVHTFGDPTDLAKEILSAYKVSDDYLNHTKEGEFVDKGSHLFSRAVDYLSALFRDLIGRVRTGSPGGVVEFLLAVLVGLVLIALMRIPFLVVDWVGSMLVSILLGGGTAAYYLNKVWGLFVDICFLVASVLVIISMVRGGLGERFHRIMADHGWTRSASPRADAAAAEEQVRQETDAAFSSLEEELDQSAQAARQAEEEASRWGAAFPPEPPAPEAEPHQDPSAFSPPARPDREPAGGLGGCLASFFFGCLKVAGAVCISFPLLLLTLTGAFVTGNVFALVAQGISLTGPALCALGGTVAAGILTAMSVCLLFRRGKGVAIQVIPLVISLVVSGFGLVLSVFEIADYEFVSAPVASPDVDTYTIPVSSRSLTIFGSRILSVQEDASLPDGTLRLEVGYDSRFFDPPVVNQQTTSFLSASSEEERERLWEDALEAYNQAYEEYEARLEEGEEPPEPPAYPDQEAIYDQYYQEHKVYRDEIDIYSGSSQWNSLGALWDFYVEGLRSHQVYDPDSFTPSQLTVYLSSDLVPRLYNRSRYSLSLDSADHRLQQEALGRGEFNESATTLSPDNQDLPLSSNELYPRAESWEPEGEAASQNAEEAAQASLPSAEDSPSAGV